MKAEKFIREHTRNHSNAICDPYDTGDAITIYAPWLTPDQALSAVAYAREEMIDKACEWLRTHSEADYFELIPFNYCGAGNLNKKKMIDDFKKAMEE